MKTLLKTVSITLIASVTVLFFSSYRKVEAAAAGAAVAAGTAIAAIGSLIVSAAAYFADTFPNVDVAGIISHTEFKESISVSEDGTATYTRPSSPYVQVNEKAWAAFNALAEESTKEYNSSLSQYVNSSGDDPDKNGKIPSSSFNAALNGVIAGLISEFGGNSGAGSGAASGITSGISVINGKPQKVTTTYAESTVEIFDYLQLYYNICNSVFDILIDIDLSNNVNAVMSKSGKYLPFIIQDDKLYVMASYSKNDTSYLQYTKSTSAGSGLHLYDGLGSVYLGKSYMAFRIANLNGQLCYAFFGCSRYENPNQSIRVQRIYGKPKPTTYPILFNTPSYFNFGTVNSSFDNYEATYPVTFINASDVTDILSDDDIINKNYTSCGYFKGTSSSNFSLSGTIGTAGKMMSGTENAVQGGTNTTYSELSDIEKAIYALAKQQGITYEEMLEQSNLVVENGQIYLEGLDGVTHSIESLLSEFDKLLEQGDITNENIAASTEQLKAILEYLKGLNIEGLGSYIQQLETTLDGLKQGDKDREAILGDISGQLTDLKDYLDSLGLAGIGADIKNISQILSDSAALELDVTEIESIDPDWYIEKFPFCLPFDFYRILTLFVRDPVPPVFTVPIEAEFTSFGLNQSVDEEIVLDLTVFKVNGVDIVQVVLNFVCILGFVLMLIHTTTKFFV